MRRWLVKLTNWQKHPQVDSNRTFEDVLLNSELVAKVELSTFAVASRHQETSEKLYFRGFSGKLRTVFWKTSVGLWTLNIQSWTSTKQLNRPWEARNHGWINPRCDTVSETYCNTGFLKRLAFSWLDESEWQSISPPGKINFKNRLLWACVAWVSEGVSPSHVETCWLTQELAGTTLQLTSFWNHFFLTALTEIDLNDEKETFYFPPQLTGFQDCVTSRV
jgi:hypothetical protein